MRSWSIFLAIAPSRIKVKPRKLKSLVLEILGFLDRTLAKSQRAPKSVNSLSLSLISDKQMRVLNRTYRRKDKATDVLSFSQLEGVTGDVISSQLGDLVISLDTTLKQAKLYRVTPDQELLRLVIHGLLHLHGFDHENVSSYQVRKMQSWEDRLMRRYQAKPLRLFALKS